MFIFCTEMNTRRFPRDDDIRTVQKLTEAFGSKLWEHAVVVLTFANEVYPPPHDKDANMEEFFDKRIRNFKKKIQKVVLNVGVPEEVIINVPFVAAGDLSEPKLPGIDNWLTAFWIATFKRLNRSAQPAFFLANIARLLEENQVESQMQPRSFQGFESIDKDECCDGTADRDGALRQASSHPVVESTPLKRKPEQTPKRPGSGNGATKKATAIVLGKQAALDIVKGVLTGVVLFAGQAIGDMILPGLGTLLAHVKDILN